MMGNCYIDGVDCYAKYGVRIAKGGYAGLLSFPAIKEPEHNDWPDDDGREADLSAPCLASKEISIPFITSRMEAGDLIDYVSKPGYHTLYVPALGRSWSVRLAAGTAYAGYSSMAAFTLRFMQDMPVRGNATPAPGLQIRPSAYELDSVPLDVYGITVESARDSLLKTPPVKTALTQEIKTGDGREYDAESLFFQPKEVTFKCYLKAVSMTAFWKCYDAFFYALLKPGERELYADYTGECYRCHYKGTSGWTLYLRTAFVIVEFSLAMVFTDFRTGPVDYLLSTEDGKLIVTEDEGYAINLNKL
jgi:hypothetical protein